MLKQTGMQKWQQQKSQKTKQLILLFHNNAALWSIDFATNNQLILWLKQH